MKNNEILVRKAIEDKEREANSYEDQECYNAACIAVIFAWVFDVRVTAYFEAQVVFEGDFSVIVNGHLEPSFLINAKRRTSQIREVRLKAKI